MLQKLSKWVLCSVLGYTIHETVEKPAKYIIALAPHTSNWDFLFGQLYCQAMGVKCGFMMKAEWFFWPLGPLFRRLGGIPVHRSKKNSLTDQLAQVALDSEEFHLCITPEGTRKLQPEWKKGFYYIAFKAQIPILLYGLDYKRKLIECTCSMVPTGDVEREMEDIKRYFASYQGRHPELFTTGL